MTADRKVIEVHVWQRQSRMRGSGQDAGDVALVKPMLDLLVRMREDPAFLGILFDETREGFFWSAREEAMAGKRGEAHTRLEEQAAQFVHPERRVRPQIFQRLGREQSNRAIGFGFSRG